MLSMIEEIVITKHAYMRMYEKPPLGTCYSIPCRVKKMNRS